MKTTRNLFVLVGSPLQVAKALAEINFKGLVVFREKKNCNIFNIVFNNNKSIVCPAFKNYKKNKNHITIYVYDSCNSCDYNCENFIFLNEDVSAQFEEIADRNNCDIGDHISNSSGLNRKPSANDCAYCNFIKSKTEYDSYNAKILYSSKHFFVKATVGEFCLGYLLIIPYKHVMSSGEFSQEQLEDFNNVLTDIKYLLTLTYGISNFLVWENGTGNSGKGKTKDSIAHSYIHIAPSKLTAQSIIDISKFNFDRITLQQITNYGENSYLLIQDVANKWIINESKDLYIPKQYIRQLLADEYSMSDFWNWKTHPFKEFMQETTEDILKTIITNYSNLPQRIINNTKLCIPVKKCWY